MLSAHHQKIVALQASLGLPCDTRHVNIVPLCACCPSSTARLGTAAPLLMCLSDHYYQHWDGKQRLTTSSPQNSKSCHWTQRLCLRSPQMGNSPLKFNPGLSPPASNYSGKCGTADLQLLSGAAALKEAPQAHHRTVMFRKYLPFHV